MGVRECTESGADTAESNCQKIVINGEVTRWSLTICDHELRKETIHLRLPNKRGTVVIMNNILAFDSGFTVHFIV